MRTMTIKRVACYIGAVDSWILPGWNR